MSHDRTVIRHAVQEIGFGFLNDNDIRRLSVKRITSPVTFDTLNNPLPGGLYDPMLGPVDKMMMCETCGQDQKNCPGHIGHIELAVSVYHPILFGALYKLLRAKCFSCHNLRLSKSKTRVTAVKMMLVDAGRAQEALELDVTLLGYLRGKSAARVDDVQEGHTEDSIVSASTFQNHVLGCLEKDLAGSAKTEWCGGHNRQIRRQLAEGLIKSMGACKRCENCGAFSPKIRKDGSNKLFQVPLNDKMRQANQSCNAKIVSAVQKRDPGHEDEEDGDDSDPMSEDEDNGDRLDDDGDGGDSAAGKVTGVSLAAAGEAASNTGTRGHKFMPPIEVELQMQQLWKQEAQTLDLIFASGEGNRSTGNCSGRGGDGRAAASSRVSDGGGIEGGYRMFFIRALAVPPPRFRPPMNMGDMIAEHPQNVYLTKVLTLNESLKNAGSLEGQDLASVLTSWVELQTTVNCYMDSSKDPRGLKDTPPGLRQVLEKKEGLFRKHMMGKRVNYACRSVISPDPYIGTTEIGIPLRFAKELTYPQPVAGWNVEAMRKLVENGASVYPGANFVEDSSGRMLHLDRLSDLKRRGVAARLLSTPGQKVWRHLTDGDCMLVNRQPTLHKPGIMAHRVRVLRNPGYQTIRMHYANCNTYNADFDGDEINCHLPQNEVAKAEANLLAFTDEQYLVPTNGKPLRGLIQDHVDAGVKMCSKDCFFSRGEYQQLVYQALSGLPGLEIVPPTEDITTVPPAILKPQQRWTGKQVMSTILKHLTTGLPQLNLDGKSKTPKVAFGEAEQEHVIIFREGELLQGVLDKGAFGASEFGLVHAVHEVYGSTAAGKLLTALGRVLTIFLQYSGHTCGIEDLTLTARAEGERRKLIKKSLGIGQRSMQELLMVQDGGRGGEAKNGVANGSSAASKEEDAPLAEEFVEDIRLRTAAFLLGEGRDGRLAQIDRHMQSALAPVSSDIIKACLPGGQAKPFPHNCFSLMVLTGAKGSIVNHSQVSCALGQQALEGRRVPVMVSGKSLPSFQAFEPSPRANGFITDRFLTGIRPQEYYFHCMAGREGLVDTAVKTSRSGYLQRCLVKHLEELKVGYDNTVRDGEGCVHQFLYGEDGVDTTQTKYLLPDQLGFLAQNHQALRHKHGITPSFKKDTGFDTRRASRAHSDVAAAQMRSDKAAAASSGRGGVKFVAGESVLAKRRAVLKGGEAWGQAKLLDGWHSAEVVKVRNAGTPGALYSIRYKDDGAVGKKLPVAVAVTVAEDRSQDRSSSSPSDEDENGVRAAAAASSARQSKRQSRCLMRKDPGEKLLPDPVLSTLSVNKDLGCVSEAFQKSLQAFLESDPPSLHERRPRDRKRKDGKGSKLLPHSSARECRVGEAPTGASPHDPGSLKEAFELLMWVKYMRSLAAPGETVGSIAAQSVGEPSTQMTLNTFHLAGHGGANVTLGIPRLREIIMTAAKSLKTPSTVVPLRMGVDRPAAVSLALQLSRLCLSQLLDNSGGMVVRERLLKGDNGLWERHYAICLKLIRPALINKAFSISFKELCRKISSTFVPNLLAAIAADLRRTGTKLSKGGGGNPLVPATGRGKSGNGVEEDGDDDDLEGERSAMVRSRAKKASKAEAEYESDDEDEDQGTLKFGKQKEQASYGDMDEDEKAMWKAMSGREAQSGVLGDEDEDDDHYASGQENKEGDKDYFELPKNLSDVRHFKGITKNKAAGEVEVTVRLPSSVRRLLMVGLAESAADKTMVRSHKGINGAFVVETTADGKSGLAVQLEGSNFETVWQLKEAGADGILNLNKLTSNDVWAVCQTYGVEAARASIVAEITSVFGAYGIAVDPRHLGLVADHMTFDGGYRPLNRAGMADFSSPCLQMSFETTTDFMAKAAIARSGDKLKSPSARIVMGRVGDFGTGMFDLRQRTEFGGLGGIGVAVGGAGGGEE